MKKLSIFSSFLIESFSNISALQQQLKKCHLFIAVLFFTSFIYAGPAAVSPLPVKSFELSWQLDKTVSGVEFFYAISSCKGNNVVFLKMNNQNKYNVEVSWKEVFQTQLAKDKEGAAKRIVLTPGETFEADCDRSAQPALVVSSSQVDPTYVVIISKFNYKDISVNKVK